MRENFGGTRILIIEDEFIIANDLRNILKNLGYDVVAMVDNYQDALEVLKKQSVDLALIDIILKGDKSGIDLAHEIKSTSAIPFIFVTSHTDESTLSKAKSTDPYGYIVKPFEEREILASIEIALYKKENENISKQEFEKNLLLEISKDLSGATSKKELIQSVENRLSGILPDIAGSTIALSANQPEPGFNYYLQDSGSEIPIDDSQLFLDPFIEFVLQKGSLEEIALKDASEEFPKSQFLQSLLVRGITQIISLPIVVSGGRQGAVLLQFVATVSSSSSRRLLSGVAELLSMSVTNRISDEEIRRSQGLQRLQLDLTNSLDNKSSVETQLQRIIKVLEEVTPFHLVVLYSHAKTTPRLLLFNKIGFEEYQVLDESALINVLQLKESAIQQLLPNVEGVRVAPEGEHQSEARLLFLKRYGIQSLLQIPIGNTQEEWFCLDICSRVASVYNNKHVHLAARLRSTLRLLLENIFAFEAIHQLTDQLQHEKQYLMEELESSFRLDGMTSHAANMQQVIVRVETVATTDASVLIQGETGTGKELTARAIHRNSTRSKKPFIKINCAAIPSQLIESELFGHEKGAFTGAHDRRIGKFELANKGTLFLDEIGELPLELQPKLLRALQEGEFERLGSNKTLHADIRLICATNRNLSQEVNKGNFRADLFYRISVFPIDLPPLRERREDIEPLAISFGREICEKQGSSFFGFADPTLASFSSYHWPGNIRELRNVVEQLCILYRNKWMHWDMPEGIDFNPPEVAGEIAPKDLKSNILQTERDNILVVLRKTAGRIRGDQGAASILGMKPTTLEYRIKKLNISKEEIFD